MGSVALMENDEHGFVDLKDQLLVAKENVPTKDGDIRDAKEVTAKAPPINRESKKYTFRKGEENWPIDEDAQIEIMADKRPVTLTLRELRERASGDIAVKNRMHALAEEKKKVTGVFKQFTDIAKKDPIGALEFISAQAKEADSDFAYNSYLEKLAEQAESLGQMDEKDRKNWEQERKLSKAEEDLSQKKTEFEVNKHRQELLNNYPEIGDQNLDLMVDAILQNPDLAEGIEDDHDLLNRAEDLINETLTQKQIIGVINRINPEYANDNELIFALSDQLQANPDLSNQDIQEIIMDVIGAPIKPRTVQRQPPQRRVADERQAAARTLSHKARQGSSVEQMQKEGMSNLDSLAEQLIQNKEKQKQMNKFIR